MALLSGHLRVLKSQHWIHYPWMLSQNLQKTFLPFNKVSCSLESCCLWLVMSSLEARSTLCLIMQGPTTKFIQSSFYHLRNISKIWLLYPLKRERLFFMLSFPLTNSLFTCLRQKSISWLQVVQSSTARLLTWSWRNNHITLALSSLYWLPECFTH